MAFFRTQDRRTKAELLADPKECSEHRMLVDLARNDIGRFAEKGTVQVKNMMHIKQLEHVMHIVTDVYGRKRKEVSLFEVIGAVFPAGTLSGAPKIRAMEIIAELEQLVSEIKRIQEQYGRNAFAMLSGVSLSTEKSYLVGKFARVALKTANLDYNGRLCMVSAGAGNKKAFGMDRSSNSWADLAHAEVIIITGANISECFPVLTYRIWEARDNGAKIIVIDPRVIPLARTADVHLPLRSGADTALMSTMLKVLIDNDWLDHDFIDNYTSS